MIENAIKLESFLNNINIEPVVTNLSEDYLQSLEFECIESNFAND